MLANILGSYFREPGASHLSPAVGTRCCLEVMFH